VIHQQFDVLVALLRGRTDTPANIAARAVLVDGHTQAEAMRLTGATRSTVADAVKRYSDADAEIRSSYGACMYASKGVHSKQATNKEARMQIELKVRKHPSGRYTLTEQSAGDKLPRDCTGNLFTNDDAGTFYKAVAAKIANLSEKGFVVKYHDRT
jgi:hypothetical protein